MLTPFLSTAFASGAPLTSGASDIAGADPVKFIVAAFVWVAGFVAAAVILVGLWAVIKKLAGGASSTAQSDSRQIISNLALGLALFLFAALFFEKILNIRALNLPVLPSLKDATGGAGGGATCQSSGALCADSPPVNAVRQCLDGQAATAGLSPTTYNLSHSANSCHFGGINCKREGAHAMDFGVSGLTTHNPPITLAQMKAAAEQCASQNGLSNIVSCRCETEGGAALDPACSNPASNHVHCNFDNQRCGCN